jgi:hypothetical protein
MLYLLMVDCRKRTRALRAFGKQTRDLDNTNKNELGGVFRQPCQKRKKQIAVNRKSMGKIGGTGNQLILFLRFYRYPHSSAYASGAVMSIRNIGFALCVLLAAGCSEASSFSPEGAQPPLPSDAVVVPGCRMKDYFPRQTRASLALAESSGDLRRMAEAMRAQRAVVDAAIYDDPKVAVKLKPVIDHYFSNAVLRDRARCEFVGGLRDEFIPVWAAWVDDPAMQRIHVWAMTPPKTPTFGVVHPERLKLLMRLSHAMGLNEMLTSQQREREFLAAVMEDARDPMSSAKTAFEYSSYWRGPGDEAIAQEWLSQALKAVNADELNRFLVFAESEAGQAYYRNFASAYYYQQSAWHSDFAKAVAGALPQAAPSGTPAEADAMVAEAKQLNGRGDVQANGRARLLLQRAAAIKPKDAEIKLLLGQIAMTLREGQKPDIGELRVPTNPKYFAEAERYLKEAIALDPTLAQAYLSYGRARFLQEDDAEAARNFQLARQYKCDCARIDLYEGDLMAAKADWKGAGVAYRTAFANPSSSDFTRSDTFAKLSRIAVQTKRPDDIRAIGEAYMQQHPDDSGIGEIYSAYLMNELREYAAALKIIDGARGDHGYGWTQLRAMALSGLAQQGADKRGSLSGKSAEMMQEAIALIGGPDLARMHCLSQSDAATMRSIATFSDDSNATATYVLGCVIFTHNTDAAIAVIQLGADVNAMTQYAVEDMPLCHAVFIKDPVVFRALLDAKADPARKCRDGRDVRSMLEGRQHEAKAFEEMLRMLDHGPATGV